MNHLKLPLTKVSATGNDFIVVDLLARAWEDGGDRAEWVRKWCDRHNGIGADGVAFLEKQDQHDFAWDFYNSDGSRAEMCGNAARAVSLYVSSKLQKRELKFLTRTGTVNACVKSAADIEVEMAPIAEEQWNQWSENENNRLAFDFVRAGVPHVVLRVPDISDYERLRALALEIKRDARFTKDGTNVTFVKTMSALAIQSVTFERGVEGFTLSCGTGAVAAAHSILHGEENKTVQVAVPGGQLTVVWKNGRPVLQGPARIIADIYWLTGG